MKLLGFSSSWSYLKAAIVESMSVTCFCRSDGVNLFCLYTNWSDPFCCPRSPNECDLLANENWLLSKHPECVSFQDDPLPLRGAWTGLSVDIIDDCCCCWMTGLLMVEVLSNPGMRYRRLIFMCWHTSNSPFLVAVKQTLACRVSPNLQGNIIRIKNQRKHTEVKGVSLTKQQPTKWYTQAGCWGLGKPHPTASSLDF